MRTLQRAENSPMLRRQAAQLARRYNGLLPALEAGPDGKLNEQPQLLFRPFCPLCQKRPRNALGRAALEDLKEQVFFADDMMVQGGLLDPRLSGQHLARHLFKSMLVDEFDRSILYGGKRPSTFFSS